MFHVWEAIVGLKPEEILRHYRLRDTRLLKRDVRFFVQRFTRGWDDGETFSLDHSLAKLIAPRLRRYRELSIGTPPDVGHDTWERILDTMVEGFEFIASEEYFNTEDEEKHAKAREARDLFHRHFHELWW